MSTSSPFISLPSINHEERGERDTWNNETRLVHHVVQHLFSPQEKSFLPLFEISRWFVPSFLLNDCPLQFSPSYLLSPFFYMCWVRIEISPSLWDKIWFLTSHLSCLRHGVFEWRWIKSWGEDEKDQYLIRSSSSPLFHHSWPLWFASFIPSILQWYTILDTLTRPCTFSPSLPLFLQTFNLKKRRDRTESIESRKRSEWKYSYIENEWEREEKWSKFLQSSRHPREKMRHAKVSFLSAERRESENLHESQFLTLSQQRNISVKLRKVEYNFPLNRRSFRSWKVNGKEIKNCEGRRSGDWLSNDFFSLVISGLGEGERERETFKSSFQSTFLEGVATTNKRQWK